jgi:hypothetical protein
MTPEPGEADETPEPPHPRAPHGQADAPRDQAEALRDQPDALRDEEALQDEEALRYEQERQERIDRRNAASWKIVGVVAAAALALLAYDSGRLALDAHGDGRPWPYPACVAAVCLLLLLALLGSVLKRRRRGSARERGAGPTR